MPRRIETKPAAADRWLRAGKASGVVGEIDREKNIIHGVALNTVGEAKGHGYFLDTEFVQNVVKFAKKTFGAHGVKSRFSHPTESGRSMGTFVGRIRNVVLDDSGDEEVARGDLHLDSAAEVSPDGDLVEYILRLAENDPQAFGMSIVFTPGRSYRRNKAGKKVFRYQADGSYNPKFDTAEPQMYREIKALHQVDVVDEPAANPDGLFSTGGIAGNIAGFLNEHPAVMTFLEEQPTIMQYLKDTDVVGPFLSKYIDYQEQALAVEDDNDDDEQAPTGDETEMADKEHKAQVANLTELKTAIPDDLEFAVESFEAGLTVEAAKAKYADKLAAKSKEDAKRIKDLEAANAKLTATPPPAPAADGTAAAGTPVAPEKKKAGQAPVDFEEAPDDDDELNEFAAEDGPDPKVTGFGGKFMKLSREYDEKHKCGIVSAMRAVEKKNPKLHKAYRNGCRAAC